MTDDAYVHRPDDDAEEDGDDSGLGPRGSWALLAILVVCFVGFPVAIYVWPPTFVPYRDAYLALAMVPALALGAVGVWLAKHS